MSGRALALATSVLLVAAAAGAAAVLASAGQQGPPVVRERFTPLSCGGTPGHRTTLQMEGCAEQQILALDQKINADDVVVWHLLVSASGRADFASAIRSWLAYRRADCVSVSDVFQGGSEEPVAYAQCVVARDRARLADLGRFENEFRSG